MFLRQTAIGREPLAVAMSGVRMGERVLQIGMDDPDVTGAIAARPGLSGESAVVVTDEPTAVRARQAASNRGALVNVHVHALESLPFEDASFDVAVIHNRDGLLTALQPPVRSRTLSECRRILRSGGRVFVLEKGTPSGLTAIFRRSSRGSVAAEGTVQELEAAGFRAVRQLGDREGYRFIEGLRDDLPK